MRTLLLLSFTFLAINNIYAQFLGSGQEPSGISWRQIDTKNFRLVYDTNFEREAQRLAALLDYSSRLVGNTLSQQHKKIPIIIHNYSIISNGMVAWAPKRMEIFPVAPQDIYSNDWFEQLTMHELRHIAQINRINHSIVELGSYLFGQSFTAAFGVGQVPPWFFEGDAVVTETALSKAGRGREPSFEMGTRAFVLENHKPYSFRKSVYGSFKDFVPNHYELGYLMVAYQRAKQGPAIWENGLDYVANDPLGIGFPQGLFDAKYDFMCFSPFLSNIKNQTGLNRKQLHKKIFTELDSLWTTKSKSISYTNFSDPINPTKKTGKYISYVKPRLVGNYVVALKSEVGELDHFVLINKDTHTEKTIHTPGYMPSDNYTVGNNRIYWNEYMPDIRWEQRNYSVIKYYEITTGHSGYLTQNTRYFSPALSPGGSFIAIVEVDEVNNNSIKILKAENGEIVSTFHSPNNELIQTPSWDENSKYIVLTIVGKEGKSLVVLNTQNGKWETLYGPTYESFSQPVFYNNYILFRGGFSGIDNIYALNISSKKIFQITSAFNGAYDPITGQNDLLYYANYTSKGFDIVTAKIDTSQWVALEKVMNISLHLAEKLAAQEPQKYDSRSIEYKNYESKPYNKLSHLINIHSWTPFFSYQTNTINSSSLVLPGYTLYSQNLQGTLEAIGGQGFVNNRIISSLTFRYSGLFPVFEATVIHGDSVSYIDDTIREPNNKEISLYTSVSFPLNFSRGSNIIGIISRISYNHENKYFTNPTNGDLSQGQNNVGTSFYAYAHKRLAAKDIIPNLGVTVSLGRYEPLSYKKLFANKWVVGTNVYIPGIFNHCAFKLGLLSENQNVDNYFIESSSLGDPRGYKGFWNASVNAKSMMRYSVDYTFPIIYPDFSFLRVLYFKRIFGNVYYEQTDVNEIDKYKNITTKSFITYGLELSTDFNLFFFPVPFNLGIRKAYLQNSQKWVTEIVTTMSLTNW